MKGTIKVRWFSSRAIWAHVTLIAVVPTFLALADWQVHRALSGNYLSWAYAVEWPVFVIYAFYTWHKIIYDDPKEVPKVVERQIGAPGLPKLLQVPNGESENDGHLNAERIGVGGCSGKTHMVESDNNFIKDDNEVLQQSEADTLTDEDKELLLYNEYLSQLNKENKRKSWF
jgi:hypothetical protein